MNAPLSAIFQKNRFTTRHLGSNPTDLARQLQYLGLDSLEDLMAQTLPASIRLNRALNLPPARSEEQALADLAELISENRLLHSCLGMGYSGTYTPTVLRRNILENPGWYTAYTPYQAEIAQGRLEALLNFQTLVCDLTGMEIANASLLDEATAAAEAMTLCSHLHPDRTHFFVAEDCHPQIISLLQTRAEPLGFTVEIGSLDTWKPTSQWMGALIQYPATDGKIHSLAPLIAQLHEIQAIAIVAADLLALTQIQAPGEADADVVIGSSQRFGVPLGYGGPHAAFLATRERFKRQIPGRLVGVSKDSSGQAALRLTLQTREQHIRRDKATSNICTAQVLLAVLASFYAIYHGPEGLKAIAQEVHQKTVTLANRLRSWGWKVREQLFFDTICIDLRVTDLNSSTTEVYSAHSILKKAEQYGINLRALDDHTITISLDETTPDLAIFSPIFQPDSSHTALPSTPASTALTTSTLLASSSLARTSPFLTHPVFNRYHTETQLLRYLHQLESRDLSLTTSMIPLGSCTMKLNATSEMIPLTWEKISNLHPFVPLQQAQGYQHLFKQLEDWLAEITGFSAVSLQPNAGSQGEYAGLLAIRAYHRSRGEPHRNICLIPTSAHGTNPASAVMAGMRVIPIACDIEGNVDLNDLRQKLNLHAVELAALMITYPSTYGVFEESIQDICQWVHHAGGQIYLDGANLNAQVGLCRPGDIGADVCHLNLHKTFCIPHGGGGPGAGPIAVAAHLAPFLPGHSVIPTGGSQAISEISAAPWGSASLYVISWMYIAMMGPDGLAAASQMAILNANYIAHRLKDYFPVLYSGKQGRVAHECILDFRPWKEKIGIDVEDIAKRLIDYGFHAPTMSWPTAGTLMIEPTESESLEELDRFCDAMIAIHNELQAIAEGHFDPKNNPLKRAPHTAQEVSADTWDRPYTRVQAAYPASWLKTHKFWPSVGRIDNVYGDRHVACTCADWQA